VALVYIIKQHLNYCLAILFSMPMSENGYLWICLFGNLKQNEPLRGVMFIENNF